MTGRIASLVGPAARPWWVALLLLSWLALAPPLAIKRLDLMVYDLASSMLSADREPDSTIVAIDERSLQALGRWPWPRDVHAVMIEQLKAAGVRTLAVDLMFNEPSLGAERIGDQRLAEALGDFGTVILPIAPASSATGIAVEGPLSTLIGTETVLAHVDVEIDDDSVARRVFLRGGVGGQQWDALPLAMWRLRAGDRLPSTLASLGHGDQRLPLQSALAWRRDVEVMLPSTGIGIPTVSFVDVLRKPELAQQMAGRAIWLGVTAAGLGGGLPAAAAPSGEHWSAVQWHAQAYEALRDGRAVTPVGGYWAWWLGALPLGLMFICSRAQGAPRRLIVAVWVLVPAFVVGLLLWRYRQWLDVTAATLTCAVAYLLWRAERARGARQTLQRVRARADAALRAIAEAVAIVDQQGIVRYVNPVAARLVGRPVEQAVGDHISNLYPLTPGDNTRLVEAVRQCLLTREPTRRGPPVRIAVPGAERLFLIGVSPVVDRQAESVVLALSDVTEVVNAGQRLQFEATHDSLTGLANRNLLSARLALAIDRVTREGQSVAVLFMDLDRFKRFNDSLGHRVGDQLLTTIAERLRAAVRPQDTVARWGGDEFVVVLDGVDHRDTVEAMAAGFIEVVSQDVTLSGIDVRCSCSIGVAMAPKDSSDPDTLLAMADAAMYRGKARAGHRCEFYSAQMRTGSRQWLDLETQLRHALGRDEFELFYQPQVRIADGQAIAFEALLRWRRSNGELVLPGSFIHVAEESGLIMPIGAWAIEAATRQMSQWLEQGVPTLPVAINISARQCLDRSLVKQVAAVLSRTGVPASMLALEITETTAMADVEHVISLLDELREIGVGIAVDDFGTGHSSLAYLKRFPINQIKVDQSFVHDITRDSNDAAIVRATIAIGHGLGVPVVAEGVETAEQAEFLAEHGCEIAQGFFYARPLDACAATSYLKRQRGQGGDGGHWIEAAALGNAS